MSTTVLELLDALRAHLAGFEVPARWAVHVCVDAPNLSAQLAGHDAPQAVGELLVWADTLTEPAADAWRGQTATFNARINELLDE